jgi:hypothetical protein
VVFGFLPDEVEHEWFKDVVDLLEDPLLIFVLSLSTERLSFHFNFLFILTMQYAQGIPPELRSNIDYVFIFNEPSVANRKRIYDSYGGAVPSFEHFCNILDACTQDHECLVIKTSGNSSDLKDQIFWYKASAHNDFRVGHPKFWKYHSSNYNEHYEEEDEKNQQHLDKLKKKFAKTRKLKVIVSREGEIVGYKQEDE